MKQLLDVSDIENIKITGVSFADDIVGLGEKRITIDVKHFNRLQLKENEVELVINRKSLADYQDERNKALLERENYAEFDHMNSMLAMLEHDFFSIDRIKLFYRNADNLSGEYVVDTSNENLVAMKSEVHNGELILKVHSK
ncbi:hypothetical protein AALF85_11670 [Jeotgalicoccus halotolerans]|uniref:hypothetical protein n=1 Tax=Jeotgalicoccus halotolerans TaxID=157227 RepID=UPI003511EFD5